MLTLRQALRHKNAAYAAMMAEFLRLERARHSGKPTHDLQARYEAAQRLYDAAKAELRQVRGVEP